MRIFITLCILSVAAISAIAQENPENLPVSGTPREKIVDEIGKTPTDEETDSIVSQILLELRGASTDVEEEIETDSISNEEIALNDIETETDAMAETSDVPIPALAPFYLSAEDYLNLRGSEKHEQMVLDYDVVTGALGDERESKTESIRLIIGQDYVSITGPKSQKIYDFKMNRFLEIKPVKALESESDTTLLFDNISLFAKAYRNISTVKQATQNGQKRRIRISEDQEIDSFWLESSMSWAAAKLEKPLKIKSTKSNVLAIWDDLSVVSASFDGEAYKKGQYKNNLFAYAHHAWPIHPKILVEFYAHNAPPQQLDMVSFGPAKPKGQQQKWTLTKQAYSKGQFPLSIEALSAVERRPISPLVFIISEAVQNKALGGMPSLNDISAAFWKAEADGKTMSQWLEGQRYNAYSGTCEREDEDLVCDALVEIEDANKFAAIGSLDPNSKIFSDFINTTEMMKNKKSRAAALLAVQPYLNDADTPAFILRKAAMARASMKKSDAKKSGVNSIQAEALLKQALAKDPYDPHTYVGLAQVYAAKGAYEQSWDIYDVLRAAIPTVGAVDLKINEAESKLLSTSPGYFLPN